MALSSRRFALLGSQLAAGLIFACSKPSAVETMSSSVDDLEASDDLVISQVFGGGGNATSTWSHDYVELFNRGKSAVSLGGKSIQYIGADKAFDKLVDVVALPNVTLDPGKAYLIQLGTNAEGGAPLPAPDLVTSGAEAITMGKDKGKVALVLSNALLDACGTVAAPCAQGAWIDFVGYGAATQFEKTPVSALSNTTAAIRKDDGCTESGDNSADFTVGTPAPRTLSSPKKACVSAAPFVLLNEVKVNPPTGDDAPWEYAEIRCTPGLSLANHWFVVLEGDGDSSTGSPGVADIVVDLSGYSCGANGLVMIKAKAGGHAPISAQTTLVAVDALNAGATTSFENGSASYLIIESADGAAIVSGQDYDATNGGVLALPTGAKIVDGIAIYDGPAAGIIDQTYAPRVSQSSGTSDGVARIESDLTPLSADAWIAADITGSDPSSVSLDPSKASANFAASGLSSLTPGGPNVAAVVPPADAGTPPADAGNGTSTSSSSSGGTTSPSEDDAGPGEGPKDDPKKDPKDDDEKSSSSSSGGKGKGSSSSSSSGSAPSVAPMSTGSANACSVAAPGSLGSAGGMGYALIISSVLGAALRRRRRAA